MILLHLALLPLLATAAPADDKKAPDKLVCRSESVSGTRVARRICMTRAERERVSEEHKRRIAESTATGSVNAERGN